MRGIGIGRRHLEADAIRNAGLPRDLVGMRQVLRLILGHGLRLTAVGLAAGLAGAFALGRVLQTLLYEVEPTDPRTYGAVALVLVVAALAASVVPALRAMRVDPLTALRTE